MKLKLFASVAALLLFVSSQAQALTYYLDSNNSGLQGGPWASVTLSDDTYLLNNTSYDAVKIRVDPLEGAFSGGVLNNFGLKEFAFNSSLEDFSNVVKVANPAGWDFDYSPSNSSGPFGKFEYNDSGKGAANPLEFYLYSVFEISPEYFAVAGDKGYIFAAHIVGLDLYDDKGFPVESAWFATDSTPVPEPGTFALLGAGLLGLFFYKRRTSN